MEAKHTRYVEKKETPNGNFYFCDYGAEIHGRNSFRLWIHPSLLEKDDEGDLFLPLPIGGISLQQGKSPKTLILRPGDKNLFEVYVPCGYRGSSEFEFATPVGETFEFEYFESPLGNLGINHGALVTTDLDHLTYKWSRSGRLYGDPKQGTTTLWLDGRREEFEGTDLCEIEDLAEVEE